jgi:Fe-S-cluster containining protein
VPDSASASPAARLCAVCGMCCNGVLFFSVRLQPEDSARRLEKLRLKIKRRSDGLHMLQPCTAHTGSSCRVYADRPARCRLFACRQLLRVEAGEASEQEAVENIATALRLTARVKELLAGVGDSREHKALSTRYETALTPPLDPATAEERKALAAAMGELEEFLTREFRIENAAS